MATSSTGLTPAQLNYLQNIQKGQNMAPPNGVVSPLPGGSFQSATNLPRSMTPAPTTSLSGAGGGGGSPTPWGTAGGLLPGNASAYPASNPTPPPVPPGGAQPSPGGSGPGFAGDPTPPNGWGGMPTLNPGDMGPLDPNQYPWARNLPWNQPMPQPTPYSGGTGASAPGGGAPGGGTNLSGAGGGGMNSQAMMSRMSPGDWASLNPGKPYPTDQQWNSMGATSSNPNAPYGSGYTGPPNPSMPGGGNQPWNATGNGGYMGPPGGGTGVSGYGGGYSGNSFTPISVNTPGYNIPTGAPPAGANPNFPSWSAGAGGGGAYNQGDPGYMASSEANRAVDYGNLFESQYGPQYNQALNQQNTYQNAANQGYNQLWAQPGFTPSEASAISGNPNAPLGAVSSTAQRMDTALSDPNLTVSDAQVQQMKDQAGRQIGLEYGAAQDQMTRQAGAAGDVNPLALAAARNRLMRSSAIDQADAVTQADLAARGVQRGAAQQLAGQRVGAATTIGGMGLQGGEYADTAAAQRAAQIAGQRIQGQQAARNFWQGQSQFQGNQANSATQARLSGAQTALSGMGQGAGTAAYTEASRRAGRPQVGFSYGPGGGSVSIGGGI